MEETSLQRQRTGIGQVSFCFRKKLKLEHFRLYEIIFVPLLIRNELFNKPVKDWFLLRCNDFIFKLNSIDSRGTNVFFQE